MKVSILGLGWFGLALAEELSKDGTEIFGTTRSTDKLKKLITLGYNCSLLTHGSLPLESLFQTDYLILNIPPREEHLHWLKSWPIHKNQRVIFISSTSQRPILLEQEHWVQSSFSHWTILRFAGLVGPNRHPGKFLSGKKDLPGKKWPVNMLHLDDAVGATKAIIELGIQSEIINVLCDDKRSREEFYTHFSRTLDLEAPEFDPDDSSYKDPVSNARIKELYSFKWPTISETSL